MKKPLHSLLTNGTNLMHENCCLFPKMKRGYLHACETITLYNRLWVVIFEKDCDVQKSQLLRQLTTVDGLKCRGC